jgi:hypothetical protein
MRRSLLGQSLAALALALVARPALAEDKPSPDLDLAMVNRLTWGATSAEVQRMRAMGAEAWLQAELHPPASERLPPQPRQWSMPCRCAAKAPSLWCAISANR